jgi:hypothetical protein
MSKKKDSTKSTAKEDDKPMFSPHIPDSVAKQGSKADEALAVNADPIIDNPSEPAPVIEPAPGDQSDHDLPVTPDPEPVADGDVDWEHKFSVLKGKYEADAKTKVDLEAENKSLVELSENQGQVLAAQAQAAIQAKTAEPAVPAVEAPQVPSIDALDVTDFTSYGDEIEALVTRVNMLSDLIKGLIDSGGVKGVDPKRLDRLEQTVQVTAEEKYFTELDAAIPNWREIDNSAEWKKWLNTQDGVSLYRLGDMLRNASSNYRHLQVIAIFKKFAAENDVDLGVVSDKPTDPVETVKTVGESNIIDETDKDPLAKQSMPDQTVAGGEVKAKPEFPTKDEYQKAVKDYTAKKITIDQFNEIANRYQLGIAAAQKANQ